MTEQPRLLLPGAPPAGRERWGKAAEKGYHETVGITLRTFGWLTNHTYPLRTEHGYRTGTTYKGWPDWTALRQKFILGIEIKGYDARGRPTLFQPGQLECLLAFSRLAGGRAWVLRPTDDWAQTVDMIRHPESAPRIFGWSPDQLDSR